MRAVTVSGGTSEGAVKGKGERQGEGEGKEGGREEGGRGKGERGRKERGREEGEREVVGKTRNERGKKNVVCTQLTQWLASLPYSKPGHGTEDTRGYRYQMEHAHTCT